MCPIAVDAQNWKLSATINPSVTFNGVHFTSDHTGYAVGTGGSIYKTINGGLSWTAQTSNTTQNLNDVYFPSVNTGYVIGENGTIRKTIDAGVTWTTVTAPGVVTTSLNEVQFLDDNNGFIVAAGGRIKKTTNGGTSWTTPVSGTINDIQGLHFTDLTTGYFVASGGLIKKSIDAGGTWSTLTVATTENLNDIFFIGSTGYACGTNGQVWQTVDGGTSWNFKSNGLGSLELYSIHFANASVGNVSSHGGRHWTTVDGATNWISFLLEGSPTCYDTYYSSVNTGYMVGTGGTVVKYQSELEPEIQPGDLTFSDVYATTMRVSYSASPDVPTGYIAVRKSGSAPTTDPMDGFTYTQGQALGDGTVVFVGNATSFDQSGLTASTQYYYKVYAYNGSGAATNYKHTDPLTGSKATYSSGTAWTSIFSGGFTFPGEAHFYDANTGGIAGGFNLSTTTNGGKDLVSGFPGNGDIYSGLYFANATTAYVVGSGTGTRVIRRTVNGGSTWVDQVRATATSGLNDVWFTSAISGVAVGGEGQIYRTTNGVTWLSVTSGVSNYLYGVNFPSATTGYAVGTGGVIIKSTSSGSAWIPTPGSTITTTNDLNDVFFTDVNTGYIVGAAGTILKTIDGGTGFSFQTSGTTEDLFSVHFIDANTGYVVGMNSTVLKTTNGGANWYPFSAGLGTVDLRGVYFPTAHTGYAAGWSGTTGTIYKFQSVPEPTSQPSGLSFPAISASGVTISFSAPASPADGFLVIRKLGSAPTSTPLDGIAYITGAVIGDGIVAYSGGSTSFVDAGLTAGATYYYQVHSYNSSGAAGSTNYMISSVLSGNTTTTLLPPVANVASSIGSGAFTASWPAVSGATSYRLDVSADGFGSLLAGYSNLAVGGTTQSVTGLSSGTAYSYRVRAVNVSGSSSNSNVISVLTLPAAPVSSAATSISTTGFTANWAAAFSATGYLLDVSTNNFSGYVGSYHDLPISATTLAITGLTAGTTYQYRVRASNTSGNSAYSSTISTITLCSPPTATAATLVTAAGFTANWSSVTGAADYRVDVASDPSFNFIVGSYNNQTVAGTSLAVTGLGSGTNYYYRVRASNTSGSSISSGAISVLTLPAPPVANDAVSIGSSTFTANWSAVATATGYRIDVSTGLSFSSFVPGYNDLAVATTSATVTVPTEGITYFYRVRTVNATGASTSSSNVISVLLKPATPVASAASGITDVAFTANWGAASGATGYTLEVSSDNFVSNIPGYDNITVAGVTTTVSNLTEGLTYKYRIRATNASWSSAASNTITLVTIPPSPVSISANGVTTTGMTARWAATAGAASYRIDVTANDFSTFVSGFNNASVTGTSTNITGLSPGVTYQYRLRAVNASGTSGNSNAIVTSTLSAAPTANASSLITSSGFTASWNSVTGATDYRLDVSTGNTFTSFEGIYNNLTVSATTIAVTGLASGTTYYYRVRSNNLSGSSSSSSTISTLVKPSAPNATVATSVSTTGFTANWDAVSGASSYKLDVSLNDFISNLAGYDDLTVSSTSKAVAGLTSGNSYKFRVRALNASGASANSTSIAAITVPPSPVTSGASSISTNSFTANWTAASGASAYFLDVSTDNGFNTFLPGLENYPSSAVSQSITGLAPGTAYYYRVRAANVSGTSVSSSNVNVSTLPVSPSLGASTGVTASGFTISWSPVVGASEYRVDISTDNNFLFYVGSYFNQLTIGTSLPVTGLSPGTVYYYRVRSANASGSSSNSSISNVLTLPAPPVVNEASSITGNTFIISWNSVSTATAYKVDVSTVSNFSSYLTGYEDLNVTATSLMINVPTEGVNYFCRVRAVSAAGFSSNSNTVSTLLKPAPPVVNAASSVTAEGFTASWLAAAGATGYYLDVSSNNFSSYITPYDNFLLAGTSISISGLLAGTNYQFRVRSYNATGSSLNSMTSIVVTVPPPPVTVQSTSFTTTSFTTNWQASAGATGYLLDVSTDFAFGAGSFVSGYEALPVTGTSGDVANLVPGTIYYYRVRAVNGSGMSLNSNVTSSTNVPPPPSGINSGSITTTGFAVSWLSAPGALGYMLDLSTNNFASFVNAYNNLSVTGTSINLVSLSPGTTYQLRLRATNTSGTSSHSAIVTVQTLPEEPAAQPSAMTITNVTTTTMNLAFTAPPGGANGYLVLRKTGSSPDATPVDALSYNLGSTLGNATVVYAGTATSFNDSGLSAGTTYFYLVFAYNGNNTNTNYLAATPLASSQITLPLAPVLSGPSAIGQNTFITTWLPVAGATDYLVEVSGDDFTTFVTGYASQSTGDVTSQTVSGLSPGKTYKYRLRSKNAAGVSVYSALQNVLTIPATPEGLSSSSISATGFELTWTTVAGSDRYFIDLSTDENFAILIVNSGTASEPKASLSGLGNSTKYYARVRAGNASGVSPSSTFLNVTTLAGSGGQAALAIGNPTFAATMKTAAVPVSVSVTGGADPKTVKFHHRKITATSFVQMNVSLKSGNVYEVNVLPEMADELGVEFYFTTSDINGTIDESDTHYFIHQAIDASTSKTIPFTMESFDGKAGSYQMFSIPYELSDNDIANLFEPALNGFSNTRWRLLRYVKGALVDYPDQLKKIELGQAYWFNTIQADFQIQLGAAVTSQATSQTPFEIVLDQGWNQVGDPFPFDVDWSVVKDANPTAGLSSIWKFNDGSFSKSSLLQAWKGAFVFSENGGTVVFPLSSKAGTGGRVNQEPRPDKSRGEWHLPMTIDAPGVNSEFSVGMRHDARPGKDKYDEIALPKFMGYLQISTSHPDFFAPDFSGDIVPCAGSQTWEFTVSTNQTSNNATISWDRKLLDELNLSVYLLDVSKQVLVNMNVVDRYSFAARDGQKLKVIALPKAEGPMDNTELGCAYPNPFIDLLRIPVLIEQENSNVEVRVYTALGQQVKVLTSQFRNPGYYELEWDGSSHEGAGAEGLLLYRVAINGETSMLRKIIKANHSR
jgi:photosystem II stability/assembly factor-like uncharacterized protein/phosphodiesterase/alkaline phosphatase D-like protein